MKNILLLGGFGFIGTNIIKYIDDHFIDDFSVIIFDKSQVHPYDVSFKSIKQIYSGDFSDSFFLESIFLEQKIDLVVHSLSTTVPATSNNVRYDIDSNLIPTIEVLNLMVKYKVKDIIFISSGGAVYGNGDVPHKEDDNTFPVSSYGVTKLAIEKYLFQYAFLYGIRPLILRLSNPYGPYQYSEKQGVCNVALRAAYNRKLFHVWGNGQAKKDYIYIEDFCSILFELYSKSIYNEIFNIGSGEVLSLDNILFEIKYLQPHFTWDYTTSSIYDVSHFELNINKVKSKIGNYSFLSFKDGLKKTCDWLQLGKNTIK